jgi:hypothetical protein
LRPHGECGHLGLPPHAVKDGGLEPAAAKGRPSRMHGTLELTKRAAARRRTIKAGIIALAVLAGIVASVVLVYTPLGDRVLTFLGFTYPKDCG